MLGFLQDHEFSSLTSSLLFSVPTPPYLVNPEAFSKSSGGTGHHCSRVIRFLAILRSDPTCSPGHDFFSATSNTVLSLHTRPMCRHLPVGGSIRSSGHLEGIQYLYHLPSMFKGPGYSESDSNLSLYLTVRKHGDCLANIGSVYSLCLVCQPHGFDGQYENYSACLWCYTCSKRPISCPSSSQEQQYCMHMVAQTLST